MNLNDLKNSKQWGLVDGKAGRLVHKENGKWEQILKENGELLGISTKTKPRPDLWLTYDEANEALSELQNKSKYPYKYSGIGLIVTNQIAVIDLDHCIDEDGFFNPLAERVLEKFKDTYIEFSKSGKGLHFYMIYNGPYHFPGNQKETVDGKIEIFTDNKVAVMTDKTYNQIEELKDYTNELDELIREFYPEKTKTKSPKEKKTKTIVESIKKPLPEDSQAKEIVNKYIECAAQAIQKAAPGDKNNTLFKKAALAGGYAWTGFIDFDTVKNQFKESLSKREGDETPDNEFDSTFTSGWNTGIQNPSEMTAFKHKNIEFICAWNGLYYSLCKKIKKEYEWSTPDRISEKPVWVIGKTHDPDGTNCGKYLKWVDGAGKERYWSMPLTLTQGETTELFKALTDAGLVIENESKLQKYFIKYLMYAPSEEEYICTDLVGWMGDDAFVIPGGRIVSNNDKKILLQTENYHSESKPSGTFEEWQRASKLVQNNSRFVLAESIAFAAPLLGIMSNSFEGGGINFIGKSGGGKTTALQLASSVWGNPALKKHDSYINSWNTTQNALENICFNHNQCLLCLDEMGECDSKTIGKTVYMISNGQSKKRLNKNIALRKIKTWNLLLLSSGEKNLSQLMSEYGAEKTKEGQLVRLADVPSDAHPTMRMVECLNGCKDSKEFVKTIQDISINNYGLAGEIFIKKVLENKEKVIEKIEYYREHFPEWVGVEHDSDACRVADRFALIAAGGELASEFGITGWSNQMATEGAKKCFETWYANHGGSNRLKADFLKNLQLFLIEKQDIYNFSPYGKLDTYSKNQNGELKQISVFCMFSQIFGKLFCLSDKVSPRDSDYKYHTDISFKEALEILADTGLLILKNNKKTFNLNNQGKALQISSEILTSTITPNGEVIYPEEDEVIPE